MTEKGLQENSTGGKLGTIMLGRRSKWTPQRVDGKKNINKIGILTE